MERNFQICETAVFKFIGEEKMETPLYKTKLSFLQQNILNIASIVDGITSMCLSPFKRMTNFKTTVAKYISQKRYAEVLQYSKEKNIEIFEREKELSPLKNLLIKAKNNNFKFFKGLKVYKLPYYFYEGMRECEEEFREHCEEFCFYFIGDPIFNREGMYIFKGLKWSEVKVEEKFFSVIEEETDLKFKFNTWKELYLQHPSCDDLKKLSEIRYLLRYFPPKVRKEISSCIWDYENYFNPVNGHMCINSKLDAYKFKKEAGCL